MQRYKCHIGSDAIELYTTNLKILTFCILLQFISFNFHECREIERLPYPFGDCTETFENSPLSDILKEMDINMLKYHNYYTYEFCQTLCRELHLLDQCNCLEEQINSTHKFCNPCNEAEETCKEEFKKNFDDDENNKCTTLCKPACQDTRYDVTLSTSEWPNLDFQEFVLKRWPELRPDFVEDPNDNSKSQLNETFINKNFLRVHVFIQEMNYLRFLDIPAYSLPELFADLGGCLGLYIGVSLISIIEFQELLLRILALFATKLNRSFYIDSSSTMRNLDSRNRSRSVNDLMQVSNKNYVHSLRAKGPPPSAVWIRERQGCKNLNVFKTSDLSMNGLYGNEKLSSSFDSKRRNFRTIVSAVPSIAHSN